MFEISVNDQFTAEHQLREPGGTLEPLHEHVWRVEVTYEGPALDDMGVLADFGVISARLRGLLAAYEGRNLNTLPPFVDRNPSAEYVAAYLAENLPTELSPSVRLKRVAVEEEAGCVARYYPPALA